jgi:hypothetical protein
VSRHERTVVPPFCDGWGSGRIRAATPAGQPLRNWGDGLGNPSLWPARSLNVPTPGYGRAPRKVLRAMKTRKNVRICRHCGNEVNPEKTDHIVHPNSAGENSTSATGEPDTDYVQGRIEKDDRLAFTQKECARLCSVGYSTFRKHVKAGLVTPGMYKRVTKEELLRYAQETYGPKGRVGRPLGPSNEKLHGGCRKVTRLSELVRQASLKNAA